MALGLNTQTLLLAGVAATPFALAAAGGATGMAIVTGGALNAVHAGGAVANYGGQAITTGGQWAMGLGT